MCLAFIHSLGSKQIQFLSVRMECQVMQNKHIRMFLMRAAACAPVHLCEGSRYELTCHHLERYM